LTYEEEDRHAKSIELSFQEKIGAKAIPYEMRGKGFGNAAIFDEDEDDSW
jgi:hypothetical protein